MPDRTSSLTESMTHVPDLGEASTRLPASVLESPQADLLETESRFYYGYAWKKRDSVAAGGPAGDGVPFLPRLRLVPGCLPPAPRCGLTPPPPPGQIG